MPIQGSTEINPGSVVLWPGGEDTQVGFVLLGEKRTFYPSCDKSVCVIGRKSSICPGLPPAGERFLSGDRHLISLGFSEVTVLEKEGTGVNMEVHSTL